MDGQEPLHKPFPHSQTYGDWLAGDGAQMQILSVLNRNGGLLVTYKDPNDPLQRKHRKEFGP